MTSEKQFLEWKNQGYNWIPIIREIWGDLDTPLSLYLKLANMPYSYLLESGFNGESWGRYSFIGLESDTRIIIKSHQVTFIKQNKIADCVTSQDPLAYIQSLINSYKVPVLESLPRFSGGLVGYFGYDTIRYIETRLGHVNQKDPLNIPDIFLILSDQLIVYDNLLNKVYIIVYVDPNQSDAYKQAIAKIDTVQQDINQKSIHLCTKPSPTANTGFSTNFPRAHFESSVTRAKEYFKAGDAMQLILSQRFSKPFREEPIQFYRTLRQVNPSPYMYYLHLGDFHIVGASPEILVRLEQEKLTVRPLAGTRLRGKTAREDEQLETELLADAKEIAEHLMLIDLGRNDIGKVCSIGSVKVTEQMVVERFSHVMHISSTVQGDIAPDVTPLEVLKATFPAGTVSGAPKVRAMEIIEELEPELRGVYGGAIGYLGWNGNMDLAIALRTAVIKNEVIFIQAGAGVVADSVPENEWQECLNKGQALFVATQLTEENHQELDHDYND